MADGYTFNWTPEGKRLKEAAEKLSEDAVGIGYQRGKATHKAKRKGEKDVDMVDIAAWNEFGTSTGIPARPFLKNSIESYQDEIKKDMETCVQMVMNGADPVTALNGLGATHKGRVQRSITEGEYEPNKPSTIRKKHGKATPLIDTGQMRQSVHYVVKKKGDFE